MDENDTLYEYLRIAEEGVQQAKILIYLRDGKTHTW